MALFQKSEDGNRKVNRASKRKGEMFKKYLTNVIKRTQFELMISKNH